jgi:hypothetical protein
MKSLLLSIAFTCTTFALGQTAPVARETLLHTQSSFALIVHASFAETAPLFGPEGERVWAGKHWDPQFVYPLPAHDSEGAVFTVKHGPFTAVWINTRFDLDAKHFQYVYFLSNLMVTTIDVRFTSLGPDTTRVNVTYTRTAIAPEGNEHIQAMSEDDKSAGGEWQQSIDRYLANRHQ